MLYRALFNHCRQTYPQVDLEALCQKAGLSLQYMSDERNWVSISPAARFTEHLIRETGNPDIWFEAGLQSLSPEAIGTFNFYLARDFASTRYLYQNIPKLTNQYSQVIRLALVEEREGFIEFRMIPRVDELSSPEVEDLAKLYPTILQNAVGYYMSLPTYHGLPRASVDHERTPNETKGIPEYQFKIRYLNRRPRLANSIASILGIPALVTALLPLTSLGPLAELFAGLLSLTAGAMIFFALEARRLRLAFANASSALEDQDQKYLMLQGAKERIETLSAAYQKFVPFEFLKLLGVDDIGLMTRGTNQRLQCSVMFFDLRQFTRFSEQSSPEEVFHLLNRVMAVVGPIILKHRGFVDKFMGDGLMALFPHQSLDALRCALQIQESLVALRFPHGEQPLHAAIGISTGPMILGVMGFESQTQCSVISDTVNVAARLEALCKELNKEILVSAESLEELQASEEFRFSDLGRHHLKGRQQTVHVYEVLPKNQLKALVANKMDSRH